MRKRNIGHWIGLGFLGLGLAGSAPVHADVLGDVNGDGQVSVADAVKLLQFIVNFDFPTDTQAILGDVYPRQGESDRHIGDRRINVQDVTQLLRFTVGLISPADFGATEQYIELSPKRVTLGPRDQLQFTAVPVNLQGNVTWTITGHAPYWGSLATDGLYIAPDSVPDDASAYVTIHATVGTMEVTAQVDLANSGGPPPPPIG